MKTALVVDFDTRRVLFQKIVESLHRLPSREDWDLNWGEPFLAISQDRRIWVRIFYEETLPISSEKLKHEMERLKPHIPEGGELCLCVPQSWGLGAKDFPKETMSLARMWSYANLENNSIFSHEIIRECERSQDTNSSFVSQPCVKRDLDFRLSSDEVRELAEIGLALKRLRRNQVS